MPKFRSHSKSWKCCSPEGCKRNEGSCVVSKHGCNMFWCQWLPTATRVPNTYIILGNYCSIIFDIQNQPDISSETNVRNISKSSETKWPNFLFRWWINVSNFLLQELEQSQDLSSRAEFRTSMFWHRTFPWGAGWLSMLVPLVGCAKCHNLNPRNRTWQWYIPTPS